MRRTSDQSEADHRNIHTERLHVAIERLSFIASETRSQYKLISSEIADLPASKRSHVSGAFLILLGVISSGLTALAQPLLNVSPAVSCTLLICGAVLIGIGTIAEVYLKSLLVNERGMRLTEQTQFAAEELERILRERDA